MADSFSQQIEDHIDLAQKSLTHVGLFARMADRILRCFSEGGTLYILGNGGSAADAQHIAAELVGRFKIDRKALPAVALTTDTSILTAVANDLGGDRIFERQVEALVTPRDILWVLSVSGRSPNVLRAVQRAKEIGATLLAFTGRRGTGLSEVCDLAYVVEHESSDRVQEMHELAYHMICGDIEKQAADSESA